MIRRALLRQIEAAELVLNDAERELRTAVAAVPEDVQDDSAVRAASLALKAAEAQLVALERLLAASDVEAEKLKVQTAKTAVIDAEKRLEKVLREAVFPPAERESWVTDVVAAAFAELKAARAQLLDLETSISTEQA